MVQMTTPDIRRPVSPRAAIGDGHKPAVHEFDFLDEGGVAYEKNCSDQEKKPNSEHQTLQNSPHFSSEVQMSHSY